jgi:hypothetical protein
VGRDYRVADSITDVWPVTAATVLGIMGPEPMSVTIEIDAPQLLPNLLTRLEAGGCAAQPIGSRACRVVHTQAADTKHALCELSFFVRAWAGCHGGVAVSLTLDG